MKPCTPPTGEVGVARCWAVSPRGRLRRLCLFGECDCPVCEPADAVVLAFEARQ